MAAMTPRWPPRPLAGRPGDAFGGESMHEKVASRPRARCFSMYSVCHFFSLDLSLGADLILDGGLEIVGS